MLDQGLAARDTAIHLENRADEENLLPHYYMISHTHWDREWYLPFEQFRFKLVKLIDHLLELLETDERFRCFHLDGQTVVLDDYLAIRPENRERLEGFIREGRILVGPWYVQNDLFLTSGESTVRNLHEGIERARRLSREMKVGYLPDHFGLVGQMPQIFQGVGIESSVFGRGYDAARHGGLHNFVWRGADGTDILGVHLPCWYNNAQRLPDSDEDLRKTFAMIAGNLEGTSAVLCYLLMNGVDHLEAQENLGDVLEHLQAEWQGKAVIRHARLEEYLDAVQAHRRLHPEKYAVVQGELREGSDDSILAGTLSARRYIKRENMACGDLLEKWLEPISVLADSRELCPYDQDYLHYLWLCFMQNHPHDSICGCSLDAVHLDMMGRYRRIRQTVSVLLDERMDCLARQVDGEGFGKRDRKLLVFNTSQIRAKRVVYTEILFLQDEGVEDFRILDPQGHEQPYRIVERAPARVQRNSPINLPQVLDVTRCIVEWQPEVPVLGYACYRITPGTPAAPVIDQRVESRTLENEYLRLDFHEDGSFDLCDKETGRLFPRQGLFEEQGDAGQMYVFQPAGESRIFAGPASFTPVRKNRLIQEIAYSIRWELPERLAEDLASRSAALAASTFSVNICLERGSRRVRIRVKLNNQSRDHRLRLLFHTDGDVARTLAGGQFDVVEREESGENPWNRCSRIQPFWKLVSPRTASGDGLFVMSRGTCEYEIAAKDTLAVTLLRGVSGINKRENLPLETDCQTDSQCLGTDVFELAIGPSSALDTAAGLYQEAEYYHQGIRCWVQPVDDTRWQIGRPWVQDSSISAQYVRPTGNEGKPALPLTGAFLHLGSALVLSALKKSRDGRGYIVRAFNPSGEPVRETLAFLPGYSCRETNLLEEETGTRYAGDAPSVSFRPKEIKTLLFIKKED